MAGLADKKGKPRLQNIDEMFGLDGTEAPGAGKNAIVPVRIDKLTPYSGNPFRLYDGERFEDMTASIKTNGVLVPVIIRKVGETLEILAGHNRVEAAKAAGLAEVPAVILEDVSDEDAMVYVIETNLIQRSFSEMTHTEKAAVIALHHSKMFSQGKRNDILEQLQILEKPHEYREIGTCAQVGHKLKSREVVASEYNLSRNTVARYLRIAQLTPELKARLDNNDFAFISAVTISFLKAEEQKLLDACMESGNSSVDMKKADMLRKLSEEGKLDSESVKRVLTGEAEPKEKRSQTVKLSNAIYVKYFKPNQPAKEVQSVVEKALELYFAQNNE